MSTHSHRTNSANAPIFPCKRGDPVPTPPSTRTTPRNPDGDHDHVYRVDPYHLYPCPSNDRDGTHGKPRHTSGRTHVKTNPSRNTGTPVNSRTHCHRPPSQRRRSTRAYQHYGSVSDTQPPHQYVQYERQPLLHVLGNDVPEGTTVFSKSWKNTEH
ncbi:hypothetical protein K439DRAFT_1620606 [Ramaria rubella]|nr:hypothetical protein K439DRAFT_1620606 [Ramaria rubella]